MQWSDAFSVGDAEIDAQHKILVGLIARLEDSNEGDDDLSEIFDRLEWYVAEHFTLEEARMRASGYPQLETHIAEHRQFKDWVLSAREQLFADGAPSVALAHVVCDYLREWLTHHILIVDMDFKGKL